MKSQDFGRGERKREKSPCGKRYIADCVHYHGGMLERGEKSKKK